jgi:UDP-GlcNAc:undecaprenyl-phosphate/decaprenyl-phosphate GlcNAc-1-phosphate transferase
MHAVPFAASLLIAVALAPALLKAMLAGAQTKINYRGHALACPFGILVLAAALCALAPLTLVQELASVSMLYPEGLPIAVYSLGVLALGLVDDLMGAERPDGPGAAVRRGWRGHGAALARGELTTGTLKAVGSLGLALGAMSWFQLPDARWLLAVGVLVLATNAFNLLDLRPGRSAKAFVALGAGLAIGSERLRPLWALGLFIAPALVAAAYDLRERAMLGDTGANLLGALAGLWLVLTLSAPGQLVALALLAAITLYGELRSISRLVERTPLLRRLDSWGRPS